MSINSSSTDHKTDAGMQRFTATGRPYQAPTKNEKSQNALAQLANADTMQGVAPSFMPVRFTDASRIPVPCLPQNAGAVQADGASKDKKKKRWWSNAARGGRDEVANSNFVLKQIPRGEYLKHYAKDEEGKYIGTEDPAEDCILKGADIAKWRGSGSVMAQGFRNEIDGGLEQEVNQKGQKESNGVIR